MTMLPEVNDTRQLKSYVWHCDTGKCFFVSTIERDSSAWVVPPPRYMETMAWEYDFDLQRRGDLVAQAGSGCAVEQHMEVCRQLYRTGKYEEPEDE